MASAGNTYIVKTLSYLFFLESTYSRTNQNNLEKDDLFYVKMIPGAGHLAIKRFPGSKYELQTKFIVYYTMHAFCEIIVAIATTKAESKR